MLKRLVAFDTTSRNSNLDLIKYIQSYLDEHLVRPVVLFDPIGARAFIGLENPDWGGLAEVLRIAVKAGM